MARTELGGSQIKDVSLTADVAGILPVANGGTGSNTLASNNVLLGNGTGALQAVAPGSADNVLKSNGSTWQSGAIANLNNVTITNYVEAVVAIGNTGTSQTISLANGTVQTATLTGNCTFTMPTATAGKSFILLLKTGAGGFTGTFTGVEWPADTAPVISAAASLMDILTFVADGSKWYGTFAQGYTP